MSNLVMEHPISFIESLLKLGKGDEGRLLYLRNALKNGKHIYESDKKYLAAMQRDCGIKLPAENTSEKKPHGMSLNFHSFKEIKNKPMKTHDKTSQTKSRVHPNTFNLELETIQNSLAELKTKESKIKDNLELLAVNREILLQAETTTPNSFTSFSNLPKHDSSDLFELISSPSGMDKIRALGIKKHGAMAYVSAMLFSLWFAGYLNILDLGPFQSLFLGFSAGAATSSGLFYRKQRNMKSNNM